MKVTAIISALKACRRTGNPIGGGIYSTQLTTIMPFSTLAGGGSGGDPAQPASASASGSACGSQQRSPTEYERARMRLGEDLEALVETDKIYVMTYEDAISIEALKRSGWAGTHVIMHTDTNPSVKSKIKKVARECGVEPKTTSHWEEEDEE